MLDGKTYLSKFFVCLDGVKNGWLTSCKRVVGIDECFLKGIFRSELLCIVRRDENNEIYSIAWGVFCVEKKEKWKMVY